MSRYIALLLAIVPIAAAALGIKLMRDTVFNILNPPISSIPLQFILGIISFSFGMYVFGGFILHRDRKRNKVQTRFRK